MFNIGSRRAQYPGFGRVAQHGGRDLARKSTLKVHAPSKGLRVADNKDFARARVAPYLRVEYASPLIVSDVFPFDPSGQGRVELAVCGEVRDLVRQPVWNDWLIPRMHKPQDALDKKDYQKARGYNF